MELKHPTPSEILVELSIRMWEPALAEKWRTCSFPQPVMNVLLILAFETDVRMSGLTGFLDNTTGAFLPDVIRAFDAIGAAKTSRLLQSVASTMAKHGVTHEQLRNDLN